MGQLVEEEEEEEEEITTKYFLYTNKISRFWFSGLYFDKHKLFKDAGFQIGRYVHLKLKSCHLTRPTTKNKISSRVMVSTR